jgi:mono/diheme cytochrome c family protein
LLELPGAVLRKAIVARSEASAQAVVEMAVVIGRDVSRIDAKLLNTCEMRKHPFDLRPAPDVEQDVAAGAHEWQRCTGCASCHGADNMDGRLGRAIIIGLPADEREERALTEAQDASFAVDNLFRTLLTKADPALIAARKVEEINLRLGARI